MQQDSADSCVLTVHGDYPGWCEESSARSLPAPHLLQCWIRAARLARSCHNKKVDQNHLMYPPPSVMAGATAGVVHRGGRWPIETSIFTWDIFPRSSSDEHLEADTGFPFSPSGFGALRDVA